MAIETAVKIDIEVLNDGTVKQAAGLYKDLGEAVSETQLRAEELAKKYGILDSRTQQAIKVAGQYKQEMEQLDFAIEAAKGGSDQLFRATQGIVGGFEVAAGAMAIFGSESEELEAALLKVQGAMALSQGIKDFNEFLPAIKNMANTVAGPLVRAFKSFGTAAKTAIAGIGIGLLITAVVTLIEYWDDLVQVFNRGNKDFKLAKDTLKEISNEVAPLADKTSKLTRAIQDNTKSEDERRMKLNELNEVYRKYGIRQVNDINDTAKLNANKEKLIKILIAEAKVRAAEGKITEETKKFLEDTLELEEERVKLKEEQTERNKKLIQTSTEYNKALEEEEKRTGYTPLFRQDDFTRIEKNYKVSLDASSKINKSVKDNEKAIEQVTKNYEDSIKPITDFIEKQENLKASLQDVNPELVQYNDNLAESNKKSAEEAAKAAEEQRKLAEQQAQHQKYVADETAKANEVSGRALSDSITSTIEPMQLVTLEFETQATRQMGIFEKLGKAAQAYGKEIGDSIGNGLEAAAQLAEAFAGEDEERQRKAFELSKKLRIAQVIMSSIQGVQDAFTTANKSPLTIAFPPYPYIQAATAAAFGLAQVKQISNQKFQSSSTPSLSTGGSGGGARPGVPQMAAPRLGGVLNPDNEITQQRKVYVVESDITSTQAKVSNTQKVSLVE